MGIRNPGFVALAGAGLALAVAGPALVGCGGGVDGGGGDGELTEAVARAGEVTGEDRGVASGVPDIPAHPGGGATTPDPVDRDEIVAICDQYRKALRGRWDDSRTREGVRGLELASASARAWQHDLADGDPDTALAASHGVVAAATDLQLEGECEALASLVAIADAMKAAPSSLQR